MIHPIRLHENLRTVVYAPFYLALARGEWTRAGVTVELVTSPDPSQTAQGVLDGRVEVGWGGPMRVMLHHDSDRDCDLVCFGQAVARDPFLLVGREPNPRFRFADLLGLRVAVASEVPTPWMTFQDDLDRDGIDPDTLDRAPDAPMAEQVARLEAGLVDVVQVLEPHADRAVQGGFGHLWHRFARRGDIGYTSFYTTRRFAAEGRETCRALVHGLAAAQVALHTDDPPGIAATITSFFPGLEVGALARIIDGYRASGLWARTPHLPADAFVRLKAALLSGGLIRYDAPYDKLVDADLCEPEAGAKVDP